MGVRWRILCEKSCQKGDAEVGGRERPDVRDKFLFLGVRVFCKEMRTAAAKPQKTSSPGEPIMSSGSTHVSKDSVETLVVFVVVVNGVGVVGWIVSMMV